VEWNPKKQQGAIRRIGLCFGQMSLLAAAAKTTPEYIDDVFEKLRVEAEREGGAVSS
jgi:hypothetical protein